MAEQFVMSKQQIRTWNEIIGAAIEAGGLGIELEFWDSMLIPSSSDSVTWETERPVTQEDVNREYLKNCPNPGCPVCVYLRGI